MPTPISASDRTAASPATAALPTAASPLPIVPIEPVRIEADAGTQELLKRHAAATGASDCREQGLSAIVGTVPIGAAVLTTLSAAAAGPIGVAAGLVGLFGASIYEGKELRALHDCRNK